MKKSLVFTFTLLFLFCLKTGYSQDAIEAVRQKIQEDPSMADAIALYPEDIRNAIFEASKYPQVIANLGKGQKNSIQDFKGLILLISREDQKKVYDLVRYPKLMNQIVQGGKKSTAQLQEITKQYPKEIRKTAVELGEQKYDLLVSINDLYQKSEGGFKNSIQEVPKQAQASFMTLANNPDVLSLLKENLEFTRLLGEAYRQDPKEVQERAQSYGEKLKKKNQAAMEEWSQEMEKDPAAFRQTQDAAAEFARDNGEDSSALESSNVQTSLALDYNPYPFWFGYPSWYLTPRWRPYPLWYDTGWYYGPGRRMVWVGWPSYRYSNWYYHEPHRRYDHLSNRYNRYYEGHRDLNSGFHHRTRERQRRVSAVPLTSSHWNTIAYQNRALRTPVRPGRVDRGVVSPPRATGLGTGPVARTPERTGYARRSQVFQPAPSRSYRSFEANSIHRSSWSGRTGGLGGARGGGYRGGGRRR